MDIKKLFSRLGIFFLGVPTILALVYFKQLNNLGMHCLLFLCIFAAGCEICNLLSKKGPMAPKYLIAVFCVLPTMMSYFCGLFDLSEFYIIAVFIATVLFTCFFEIFWPANKGENNFEGSVHAIISNTFALFYCGLLPVFISQLCKFEYSVAYLCTYFILVFGCDSLAWFFGMTMGKNNRGFIKVSPNKSVAGFVGGILCTVGLGVLCKVIFKTAYAQTPYWILGILGFITAILSILGDLTESLLKRSANIKDSGKVVMGRGGMLDSIDSLIFAVPFFYLFIHFFIA